MKYNPPYGSSNPDAPYINATPGQKGSPVPAEAIEYVQREIVNAITQAGLTPSNENLGQLYQALQKVVTGGAYTLPPAKASALGGVMVNKGGLQVTAARLLSVLLAAGGGLGMDLSGQLYVNPDSFSTEILNELLKTLRLPQWLDKNTTWYVSPSGNDANDGSTSSKAFKTIQYAVNYVSENFNLGRYNATINVTAGVYAQFTLPKYNSSTGKMIIQGEGAATIVQRSDGIVIYSAQGAGNWDIRDITVSLTATATGATQYVTAVYAVAYANIALYNVVISINMAAGTTSYAYGIRSADNGNITISAGTSVTSNSVDSVSRCIALYSQGALTFEGEGGSFSINGFYGTIIDVAEGGKFTRHHIQLPSIIGNAVGRRYRVRAQGLCDTAGGGPDFFPGSTAGTVDSANYGVYL